MSGPHVREAASPDLGRLIGRAGYALRQTARAAWYLGQGQIMRRTVRRMQEADPSLKVPVRTSRPVPERSRLLADVARLFARDLARAEAGLYPLPVDDPGGLPALLRNARRFQADVPNVTRRRAAAVHDDLPAGPRAARPDYYLQNFHFQTDGWLSAESAALYDTQVDVLFYGATGAMRRAGLGLLAQALAGKDTRRLLGADIATGTGAFALELARAFPALRLFALDLSEPYAAEAGRRLRGRRAQVLVAAAERLPFCNASLDMASLVYVLHELPPQARDQVAGELARVLRPGGLLVIVDSLQTGDVPDYDGLLETFPQLFHEPYYASYLAEDLEQVFARAGFERAATEFAFVSKASLWRRT